MSDQQSEPPAGSIRPAGVPTKSGSGLLWLGLALLLVGGGGAYFRLSKHRGSEPATAPPAPAVVRDDSASKAAELNEAPPPPPPEEAAAPEKPAEEAPKAAGAKGNAGCSGACQGVETPALVSALRAKAGQARTCYNRALRLNTGLEGKMTASVKVGPTGAPCQVSITGDTLNDAGVRSCVTQMFRSSSYPAPQNGCVQIEVPLAFVAK